MECLRNDISSKLYQFGESLGSNSEQSEQSSFVYVVACLAKYWNSKWFPDNISFSEMSSTVELVAIYAAMEVEKKTSPSTLRAFKQFLCYFASLNRTPRKAPLNQLSICENPIWNAYRTAARKTTSKFDRAVNGNIPSSIPALIDNTTIKNCSQKDISTLLYQKGERLGPNSEQINSCNSVINELYKQLTPLLHENYRYDRCTPAGSFEKKTAIGEKFDVDVVLFFNFSTNFSDLEAWKKEKEDIISQLEQKISRVSMDIINMKRMTLGVGFEVGGIAFDLVVACNMVNGQVPSYVDVEDLQFKNAMHAIKISRNPSQVASLLSSSKGESIVKLLRNTSSFVHIVARLAKYWNMKCIPEDMKFSGRSSTVELVAIYAAMEEEKIIRRIKKKKTLKSPCALLAFRRFLNYWVNINSMRIIFLDYYTKADIPEENQKAPVILDPIDQYNNRLSECNSRIRNTYKNAAEKTLRSLRSPKFTSLPTDPFKNIFNL